MKTPITNAAAWGDDLDSPSAAREFARRLELDRAALMEAVSRFLDPADPKRNCHTELAIALSAARANFPNED